MNTYGVSTYSLWRGEPAGLPTEEVGSSVVQYVSYFNSYAWFGESGSRDGHPFRYLCRRPGLPCDC